MSPPSLYVKWFSPPAGACKALPFRRQRVEVGTEGCLKSQRVKKEKKKELRQEKEKKGRQCATQLFCRVAPFVVLGMESSGTLARCLFLTCYVLCKQPLRAPTEQAQRHFMFPQ